MSSRYLLGASAVLALIMEEPGAEKVLPLLSASAITPINLAEVVKKLREKGVHLDDAAAIVSDLQISLETGPSDLRQSLQNGDLASRGRAFGLPLGDAVCLAAAAWSGRIAVTVERRWCELLPDAEIRTIR